MCEAHATDDATVPTSADDDAKRKPSDDAASIVADVNANPIANGAAAPNPANDNAKRTVDVVGPPTSSNSNTEHVYEGPPSLTP